VADKPVTGEYRILVNGWAWHNGQPGHEYQGFQWHTFFGYNWVSASPATQAAKNLRCDYPDAEGVLTVVKWDGRATYQRWVSYRDPVAWSEESENHEQGDEAMGTAPTMSTGTPEGAGFLEQPLTIPRTKLIEVLQEKLDKEQADREAIVAARAAKRLELLDAIKGISDDELTNIVMKAFGQQSDYTAGLKKLNDAVEEKTFVSPEVKPNTTESKLDQLVRVFAMADNDAIEVKPTDNLYQLL